MDLRLVAAVLLAAVATQSAMAGQLQLPPLTTREENRQVLLDQEGPGYDPAASTQVFVGSPPDAEPVTVPLSDAIRMQLDYLDRHGIRLLDAPPETAASTTGEPEWPLIGQIELTESGFFQSGARCPTVYPGWPSQVKQAFQGTLPGGSDTVGAFTTNISEAYESPSGAKYTSTLEFWHLNESTADPATGYWEYGGPREEGWTILVGFLINELQVSSTEIFCRAPLPPLTEGRVSLHAIIQPYAQRLHVLEEQA